VLNVHGTYSSSPGPNLRPGLAQVRGATVQSRGESRRVRDVRAVQSDGTGGVGSLWPPLLQNRAQRARRTLCGLLQVKHRSSERPGLFDPGVELGDWLDQPTGIGLKLFERLARGLRLVFELIDPLEDLAAGA
jgi:hypothetical protein